MQQKNVKIIKKEIIAKKVETVEEVFHPVRCTTCYKLLFELSDEAARAATGKIRHKCRGCGLFIVIILPR